MVPRASETGDLTVHFEGTIPGIIVDEDVRILPRPRKPFDNFKLAAIRNLQLGCSVGVVYILLMNNVPAVDAALPCHEHRLKDLPGHAQSLRDLCMFMCSPNREEPCRD